MESSNSENVTMTERPVRRTVLEMLAKPIDVEIVSGQEEHAPRPLRSTTTTQRTFDQEAQRPDSTQDVNQE